MRAEGKVVRVQFTPDFLTFNTASKLRDVNVEVDIKTADCARLLKLPSLQVLRATNLNTNVGHVVPSDWAQRCKDNSLPNRVDLRDRHVPMDQMRSLLAVASPIYHLCCSLTGDEKYDEDGIFINKMVTPLSPVKMTKALQPVKDTLVYLKIHKDHIVTWPEHDGTRLDLSNFNSIKVISVPSNCFFKHPVPDATRDGVWRFLPRNIEVLRVR